MPLSSWTLHDLLAGLFWLTADNWRLTTVFGDLMSVPTCTYLKPDGTVCNSPASRGKRFCYFHLDPDSRRLKAAWARAILTVRVAKARERALSRRS